MKCMADRENVANGDRRTLEDGFPPSFEGCVDGDIKRGFGRRGFCKGVGGVGTVRFIVM